MEDKFIFVWLGFLAVAIIAYVVNFIKFIADIVGVNWADMASNAWGMIIVHGIGVFTGIGSLVTVWF